MGQTTERTLVDVWDTYIDWKRRSEGEDSFFTNVLKRFNARTVLDTSMGTGFNAISLTQAGFDVVGNEWDMHFRSKAEKNMQREGIELKAIEGHDWRELSHRLRKQFDTVLCVGNSLCYLLERKEQLKALQEFYALLPRGGIAIVDQRNYEYMLKEQEHILYDPQRNFRYSRKYYYCSDVVVSYPTFISPERVDIEVFDHAKQQACGVMPTYPFRRQELADLLLNAGFARVETCGDFKKEYNFQTVDFFQHIAVK